MSKLLEGKLALVLGIANRWSLAYAIARHSLRSLDALERLLLQVTRKNDSRGYERFRDLFEAIVAYNE